MPAAVQASPEATPEVQPPVDATKPPPQVTPVVTPQAPFRQPPTSRRPAVPPQMPPSAIQAGQPAVQQAPPPQAHPVAQPGPQRSMPVRGGMISLNFDDQDVYEVIQTIFGEVLRANYIIDPRVKGRVTFRSVVPVPRENVLSIMEVILRLNGIGIVEDSNLYRIVPLSDVAREPSPVSFGRDTTQIPSTGKSLIQVVPINYLQSTEVVKLITPFLSANAVVLDVPKSNQLIIVDTDASVRRIIQLIDAFDNETQKKKRAQAYVYPVQNGKSTDIANLLQQIFLGATSTPTRSTSTSTSTTTMTTGKSGTSPGQQPISAPPPVSSAISSMMGRSTGGESLVSEITKIFADEIRNTIIILATPEDYDLIKETIAKIDTTPRQVMIEGVVAEVTLTDNKSLGLAYSVQARFGGFPGTNSLTGDAGLNIDTLQDLASKTSETTKGGFSYIAKDESSNLRVYIDALASDSRGKVLAAPHILVSDNREARIQVGQQVPIVTSSTNYPTSGDNTTTQTIQYKDIGIILKIKPQINDGGLVSLELSQEISSYSTKEFIAGQESIIVNKTEAQTNVVLQDGQTIAIGGLIREDKTNTKTGIPYLNQIPVLGLLFGNTSKEVTRRELIILLTPHVVKNQADSRKVTSKYVDNITGTGTSKGGLTKEELIKGGIQTPDNQSDKKINGQTEPVTAPNPKNQPVQSAPSTKVEPQTTPQANIVITPDNQVITNNPAAPQPQVDNPQPAPVPSVPQTIPAQPAPLQAPQSVPQPTPVQPAPQTTPVTPSSPTSRLEPSTSGEPDVVLASDNVVVPNAPAIAQTEKTDLQTEKQLVQVASAKQSVTMSKATPQVATTAPANEPDVVITPDNQPQHR